MVKVAPKNLKSIQQQKIKESRSTLKRTFNACVKKKSMKEHKNCFEKISVSRGYAATTKKSVALKKVDFFVQDLQKKSTKTTSVKFKKKIKARTSSKQLLYLRKKCLLSNKKL